MVQSLTCRVLCDHLVWLVNLPSIATYNGLVKGKLRICWSQHAHVCLLCHRSFLHIGRKALPNFFMRCNGNGNLSRALSRNSANLMNWMIKCSFRDESLLYSPHNVCMKVLWLILVFHLPAPLDILNWNFGQNEGTWRHRDIFSWSPQASFLSHLTMSLTQ